MPKITSLEALSRLKVELIMKRNQEAYRGTVYVTVGMGTCGIAAGALDVFRALEEEIKAHHLNDVVISQTGCLGLCEHETILEVLVGDAPKVAYGKVLPDMVKRIVREHILGGKVVEEFVIDTTPFPTI
jgi:NADP-reducing hydrogenase subunit HndB